MSVSSTRGGSLTNCLSISAKERCRASSFDSINQLLSPCQNVSENAIIFLDKLHDQTYPEKLATSKGQEGIVIVDLLGTACFSWFKLYCCMRSCGLMLLFYAFALPCALMARDRFLYRLCRSRCSTPEA